jgi:hypothetical protein
MAAPYRFLLGCGWWWSVLVTGGSQKNKIINEPSKEHIA